MSVDDCKVEECGAAAEKDISTSITTSLREFRGLGTRKELTPEVTERLSVQAASGFLAHYLATGEYLGEAITLLCEVATLPEENLAKPGLKGIFPLLVERLSDSFNPQYCLLYDQAFAQVVEFCRHQPAGRAIDAQLKRFGLMNEQALLSRKKALRDRPERFDHRLRERIKKVCILSRVTIGAEVAITSIIMAKLKELLPHAEMALLAGSRARQLFGGDERARVREIRYERSGGLIERLNSWLEVVETIDDERKGLGPDEFLVVDPDSRLTQLGVLPVVEDAARYFFFESRSHRTEGAECIGQITVNWVNECFGHDSELYPYVSLLSEDKALGRELCQKLRRGSGRFLVGISFGVGGNARKRVSEIFEEKLVSSLIDDGCVVVLDKGAGEEECDRVNRLVAALRRKGKVVCEIDEASRPHMLQSEAIKCHVATWEGSIGAFASLIAESDEYIGYDSAGQHIAAALAVPTIDIFADSSYPLFCERWTPYGKGLVKVVRLGSAPGETTVDASDGALAAVVAHHGEIKKPRLEGRLS
ncbi:hypothetical protein FJY63_07050 [Candidatus Sumerlaeota bacterium]|nr:hypothetical protein [Candidatus Sumerlaeota bacterium]